MAKHVDGSSDEILSSADGNIALSGGGDEGVVEEGLVSGGEDRGVVCDRDTGDTGDGVDDGDDDGHDIGDSDSCIALSGNGVSGI